MKQRQGHISSTLLIIALVCDINNSCCMARPTREPESAEEVLKRSFYEYPSHLFTDIEVAVPDVQPRQSESAENPMISLMEQDLTNMVRRYFEEKLRDQLQNDPLYSEPQLPLKNAPYSYQQEPRRSPFGSKVLPVTLPKSEAHNMMNFVALRG